MIGRHVTAARASAWQSWPCPSRPNSRRIRPLAAVSRHGRVSFFDIGDEGYCMEYEVSTDGGENWFVAAKATYGRIEP